MKKAYLLLLAVLVCASCTETFSPTIYITPSLSEVPCTGGSVDIKVMTDLPWKVTTGEESPATFSKTAGIGDDVVTVTIPATDSWTTSCITVKFSSRSNSSTSSKTAYITQDYKPYVSVSGESSTLPKEGGTATVVVTANTPWTASCSEVDGVTFSPASGSTGNTTVKISVPANPGATRRITVNFEIDGDSDHFYLYQY